MSNEIAKVSSEAHYLWCACTS